MATLDGSALDMDVLLDLVRAMRLSGGVFLDAESRTMIATGHPKKLLAECDHPRVQQFLTRGGEGEGAEGARA